MLYYSNSLILYIKIFYKKFIPFPVRINSIRNLFLQGKIFSIYMSKYLDLILYFVEKCYVL